MSVLVKGMKMPKGCYECYLLDGEYGGCKAGATGEYDPYRKDCPLENFNVLSDSISREDAVALVIKAIHGTDNKEIQEYLFDGLRKQMWSLPSAKPTGDLIRIQMAIEHWGRSSGNLTNDQIAELQCEIESLPSAEPKTGKWVQGKYNWEWIEGTDGDLISRQDALKPFCIAPDGTRIPEVDCDNFPVEFSVEFIKKHLLSLPSADRPTGEWVKDDLGSVICSECKGYRRDNRVSHTNFCNRCGAKMGGDTT